MKISDSQEYLFTNYHVISEKLVIDESNININFDNDGIFVLSIGTMKGLEFDVVFLPGWEEGLFPHQRSLDEGGSSALEEERRLAYVAITRAKQKLYILTSMNRRLYGQWQNNIPSRFINELPPQNIEICNNVNEFYSQYANNNNSRNYAQNKYNQDSWQPWYKRSKRPPQSQQSDAQKQIIGTHVYHETFGHGKVVNCEGDTLQIVFKGLGIKKINKNYVCKID